MDYVKFTQQASWQGTDLNLDFPDPRPTLQSLHYTTLLLAFCQTEELERKTMFMQ